MGSCNSRIGMDRGPSSAPHPFSEAARQCSVRQWGRAVQCGQCGGGAAAPCWYGKERTLWEYRSETCECRYGPAYRCAELSSLGCDTQGHSIQCRRCRTHGECRAGGHGEQVRPNDVDNMRTVLGRSDQYSAAHAKHPSKQPVHVLPHLFLELLPRCRLKLTNHSFNSLNYKEDL